MVTNTYKICSQGVATFTATAAFYIEMLAWPGFSGRFRVETHREDGVSVLALNVPGAQTCQQPNTQSCECQFVEEIDVCD